VTPDLRRHGVAWALLTRLCNDLAARGIETLILEANAENYRARTLYEQFGFSVVGRRRGYSRTPSGVQDALIMRLPLR